MTSRCSRCGSTSFRADRSLGGRLVCSRCGTPAGQRVGGGRRTALTSRTRRQGLLFWLGIAAIALLLVIMIQSL